MVVSVLVSELQPRPTAIHQCSPDAESVEHHQLYAIVLPPSPSSLRCPSVPTTSHRPSTPSVPNVVPFSTELHCSLSSWRRFHPQALLQVVVELARATFAVRAAPVIPLPSSPSPSIFRNCQDHPSMVWSFQVSVKNNASFLVYLRIYEL
jgi:hypothetical protein